MLLISTGISLKYNTVSGTYWGLNTYLLNECLNGLIFYMVTHALCLIYLLIETWKALRKYSRDNRKVWKEDKDKMKQYRAKHDS